MAEPRNGGYEVEYSQAVGKALRQLQRQATRSGRGDAFSKAFGRIIKRLQAAPFTVGEPQYRLPTAPARTVSGLSPFPVTFASTSSRLMKVF